MKIRAWARPAIALAIVGLALYALSVALTGEVKLSLVHDDAGTVVQQVLPDTFEWEAGLRPGQTIEWLRTGDLPGGWAVQTAEANGGQVVLLGPVELFLRASTIFALLAVGLGILAMPPARLPGRRAGLLATVGISLSVIPIVLAYDRSPAGLVVIGAAAIAPWAWFARMGSIDHRMARAGVAVASGAWATWLIMRSVEPVAALAVRNLLGAWVLVSTLLLVLVGGRVTPRRVVAAVATIRLVDVVVIAAAIVLAIVLVGLSVNVVLAGAVVALPLLLFVATRRQVADGIDRVLLAELREREAIRATEEERARVSREIHDDPLQQIAGVIRSLEADADPTAATASLRDVATKLRGVATELHPPVLDDLGLVPAIVGAARQFTAPPVEVAVTNDAGFAPTRRPPQEVELAAYRIVQEAVANAAHHAGASLIRVTGAVTPDAIDLEVADDGQGLDEQAIEAALQAGRMGVASMRRRAAAIGADLDIVGTDGSGTTIAMRWRR